MARTVDTTTEALQDFFPEGSTVYTVIRHTSQSGMQRAIQILAVDKTYGDIVDVSHYVAEAGLFSRHPKHPGLKVNGAGMDMAYHVAYTLARTLYGDGYALTQRAL